MAFLVDETGPPIMISPLEQYQYEKFSAPREIRLLQCWKPVPHMNYIARSLEIFSVDKCPDFIALSYTWGDAIHKVGDAEESSATRGAEKLFILVDGTCIPATRNLLDAVASIDKHQQEHYALGGYFHLWIDAICINQHDIAERSSQVLLMGDIYSSALMVHAWLGEDESDLEGFIQIHACIGPAVQQAATDPSVQDLFLNRKLFDPEVLSYLRIDSLEEWRSDWQSYYRFYGRRRWFNRVWVLQEFALAKMLIMFCGSKILPSWETLRNVEAFLIANRWEVELSSVMYHPQSASLPYQNHQERCSEGLRTLYQMKALIEGPSSTTAFTQLTSAETQNKPRTRDLTTILWFAQRMGGAVNDQEVWYSAVLFAIYTAQVTCATDLRDKIYAIVALFDKVRPEGLLNPFQPDYADSVRDVYTMTSSILVKNMPNLLLLSLAQDPRERTIKELPSWVPDYSEAVLGTSLAFLGHELMVHFKDTEDARETLSKLPDDFYDASLTKRSPPAPRSVNGHTLIVEGAVFDEVESATKPIYHLLAQIQLLKSGYRGSSALEIRHFFDVIKPLDPTYPETQESREDVLWRTMVANFVSGCLPARDEIGKCFRAFLLNVATLLLKNSDRSDTTATEDFSGRSTLGRTMKALFREEWDTPESMAESVQASWDYSHSAKAQEFTEALNDIGFNKCLYRTKRGLLGLGPASTNANDEVWLIQGARLPFVLRRCAERTNHTLVGGTYVHGFMHGKMLSEELRERLGCVRII
jgi:hypothetical protein